MLEQRVERLEKILSSLEPKITELLLTCAKKDDFQRLQLDLAKVEGRMSGIDGRLAGIEGRMSSIEGRFSMIPTTWQILTILATLLIGVSAMVFTTAKYLHP